MENLKKKKKKNQKVACSSHVGVSDMQSFECAVSNEIIINIFHIFLLIN